MYWTVAPELNGVRIDNPPNQVDSGSTLRLTCLSSGVHGSIKWLHQNKEVRTSQRVNIMIGPHESSEQRSSTLTVTNVSSRDAGLYTCRVFVLGSKELHISDSHEVRIATKNVPYEAITLQKELEGNVVVKVGQNLTLTASMEVPVKCFSQSHSWTRTRQMGGSNVTETLSEREALGTMYYTSDNLTRFQLEKTNIQPSDAGVYEFSLKACGRNGSISYTVTVVDRRAHVNGNAKSSVNLLVVVVFVVLLVVSMIHISCFVMKRNGAKRLHGWLDKSSVGFYDTSHMVDQSSQETGTYSCRMSDYESHFTGRIIAGSKLQLEPDVFGKGQYGYVYKGKLHDRDVAVKRLKSGENVKSLTEELRILDHLQSEGRHVHIVEMVGVVFCPEIMIVFEFCPRGNLLSFLQTIDFSFTSNAFAVRISKSLGTCNQGYYNFGGDMCDRPRIYHDHLMQYAAQISSAMQFLAAKMVIHRDVAARNVLVVSLDKVKLCDFGLSKMFNGDENVEYKTPGAKAVPYKWMSPVSGPP